MKKKRVLIPGGGFGGIYAALEFEKRQDPDFEVTLISQDNFFLFTPMLHEVAASDLDLTHIVNPIRKMLRYVHFFEGEVRSVGIAQQIARYSDAIETTSHLRWLHPSGTPGLTETGELPKDITSRAWLAWQHISEMLERPNLTPANLVKVTQYLTNPKDVSAYVKVRSEILGDVRPAFMLLVVTELIRPAVLVEVEVVAAGE